MSFIIWIVLLNGVDRKAKGDRGEASAVSLLESKGFEVIERNYRHGRGEIDLIGLKNNQLLVFVEVKLRKNNRFGDPEAFVSERQQELITEVAEHYMEAIHWQGQIRFDIIAINESLEEMMHFEDVM